MDTEFYKTYLFLKKEEEEFRLSSSWLMSEY